MGQFNAGKVIDRLTYDFSDFDGGKGTIPEPSTGRVNDFFNGIKDLVAEIRGIATKVGADKAIEDMSEEDMAIAMENVDEATAKATDFNTRSLRLLALLCGATEDEDGDITGGSPTYAELEALPYRVQQAFSAWLIQEIRPKKATPGSRS